jgi:hypothetical protein
MKITPPIYERLEEITEQGLIQLINYKIYEFNLGNSINYRDNDCVGGFYEKLIDKFEKRYANLFSMLSEYNLNMNLISENNELKVQFYKIFQSKINNEV